MSKYFSWIPRPFKMLQRYLQIENEWKEFKELIKPHKFKITVILLITTYPYYSPYLKKAYNDNIKKLAIKTQ
jgi:hypothetical protein